MAFECHWPSAGLTVRGVGAVLSEAWKTGGVILGQAIKRKSRDANPAANGPSTGESPGPDLFPPAPGAGPQPGGGTAPRPVPRRAPTLKNWRVRSRLLLLVIIPTVTAVAAGGVFITSSVQSAIANQRVLALANLSGKITGLVQALQDEREDTVRFIVLGSGNGGRGAEPSSAIPPGSELGLLNQDYAVTNTWADQVKAQASGIGGAYSGLAQQDTQAAVTAIGNLPAIRAAAIGTQLPAPIAIEEYATAINALLAVETQIAVGSGDSTLAGAVRVLGLVSSMKEEASQQQALLTSALQPDLITLGQFGSAQQLAITDAQAQQQGNLNEFDTAATPAQRQLFDSMLSTPNVVLAQAQEQQAISLASSRSPIATDPTISDASSALTYVVSGMRSAEQQFADSVISRSESLHTSAISSAIIFSLAVALLLGIALVATILIGQSMVGPLRRLRNEALEVAEVRLPEMVRRIGEPDGDGVSLEVEPIDIDSSDEIGEVARAFDRVHREAVRLAANEAALRGNVNAMFVNLSRRSQSLVERQIRVITRLERSEQDSERLAGLFQVDHLATRMRRNSENLLVLAGHELSRRWGEPVTLVDVLRAAVSEIEQYERVTLNVQPGVSIHREAVRNVVHLTAELVENATSFSPSDTPVTIEAYQLSSGGALIEITDQGVGMRAEAMGHANWRLDNPPTVDVEVSRRMGLFVVAQLAARHGIRIRLRPAPSRGLSALVWLPAETITTDKSRPGPLRSFPAISVNQVTGPVLEAGEGEDAGLASIAPAPRRAPLRERLSVANASREPFADSPVRSTESRAPSGPLAGIGGHLRTAELDPGLGARDAESGPVVALAADGFEGRDRLPVFDAVESDWFRGGRPVMGKFPQGRGEGWSSRADDGWSAAEAAKAPASHGTTRSGLPKRAPGGNLVPGTAAAAAASESTGGTQRRAKPARTATDNRNRFASYQRGIRRGRTAAAGGNPAGEQVHPHETS
jgi:signal transduction histidine kinase